MIHLLVILILLLSLIILTKNNLFSTFQDSTAGSTTNGTTMTGGSTTNGTTMTGGSTTNGTTGGSTTNGTTMTGGSTTNGTTMTTGSTTSGLTTNVPTSTPIQDIENEINELLDISVPILNKENATDVSNDILPYSFNYKPDYEASNILLEINSGINFEYNPPKIPQKEESSNYNEHIKPFNELTTNIYPCRKREHSWDYTGIHKTEKKTDVCSGINSAINKIDILYFSHPSNYVL